LEEILEVQALDSLFLLGVGDLDIELRRPPPPPRTTPSPWADHSVQEKAFGREAKKRRTIRATVFMGRSPSGSVFDVAG